jgi:hypothetical protein
MTFVSCDFVVLVIVFKYHFNRHFSVLAQFCLPTHAEIERSAHSIQYVRESYRYAALVSRIKGHDLGS